MAYPDVKLDQLYVGSIVTVYSRQLKITDYGDTFTRKHFARGKETQFALIKPDVYMHTGKIIDSIYRNGFIIAKMKMSRFSPAIASKFCGFNNHEEAQFLTSDVSTGLEIVADSALSKWNSLIGPSDPVQAKMNAPSTLRAAYGTDRIRNAVHGSEDFQSKKA